jgi:hypothetical protein
MNPPIRTDQNGGIREQDAAPAAVGPDRPASPGPAISPALGCLLSVLLGLVGVLIVFQTAKLATQGEIRIGGTEVTPNRIWLVREGANRGLGWSSSRVVEGSRAGPEMCVATSVSFLLWRKDGTAVPVDFCECYEQQGSSWQLLGGCEEAGP